MMFYSQESYIFAALNKYLIAMKKIITLAAALLFVVACSKNDDKETPTPTPPAPNPPSVTPTPDPTPTPPPTPPEQISMLPKKSVAVGSNGDTETMDYTYEGDKIRTIKRQVKDSKGIRNSIDTYTYEGDLVKMFTTTSEGNSLKTTYFYDGGLLKSRVSKTHQVGEDNAIHTSVSTTSYTYKGQKLVSWYTSVVLTKTLQGEKKPSTIIITDSNTLEYISSTEVKIRSEYNGGFLKEISYSKVYFDADGDVLRDEGVKDNGKIEYRVEYTYSNEKTVPWVTFFRIITPEMPFVGASSNKKNILTGKIYNQGSLTSTTKHEYSYDDHNRLTKIINTNQNSIGNFTETITYEY